MMACDVSPVAMFMQKDAKATPLTSPHNRLQDHEVAHFGKLSLGSFLLLLLKEKELQARRRFLRRLISPCILRRQQGKRWAGPGREVLNSFLEKEGVEEEEEGPRAEEGRFTSGG